MTSSPVCPIERRGRPRIYVELMCRNSARSSGARTAVGRTLNISRTGVLIAWDADGSLASLPSLGDHVRLDIELPANQFGGKSIRCRGKVVRLCAADRGIPQVALAIDQMEFHDDGRQPVAVRPPVKKFEEVLL